ncbi:DUF3325 family protein [Stutzerimonas nitrititolerans]|uniref:DUF3325 family protein n=1 Tax=Stutzerimonas nitrititolerans TaxID=2482751 RepID=UPI0035E3D60F
MPVITNRSSAASLHSARHGRCACWGWLLLACAIVPAVMALGMSVGLACWAALLSLATALLVLLLTYRPRLIVPLALGAPPLVLPFLLF